MPYMGGGYGIVSGYDSSIREIVIKTSNPMDMLHTPTWDNPMTGVEVIFLIMNVISLSRELILLTTVLHISQ